MKQRLSDWREVVASAVSPHAPASAEVYSAIVEPLLGSDAVDRAGVGGSLARQEFDRWSDLDLVLVGSGVRIAALVEEVLAGLPFPVVAGFTGSHLARPQLRICYFRYARHIVKADIEILSHAVAAKRRGVRWIGEGRGAAEAPVETADIALLGNRAVAWLWFCAARIARGEAFAAARAIDFYREDALLPVLLHCRGMPLDGHRRIESRVERPLLEKLVATYPTALTREELYRSLCCLAEVAKSTFGEAGHPGVVWRIEEMMVEVRRELAVSTPVVAGGEG